MTSAPHKMVSALVELLRPIPGDLPREQSPLSLFCRQALAVQQLREARTPSDFAAQLRSILAAQGRLGKPALPVAGKLLLELARPELAAQSPYFCEALALLLDHGGDPSSVGELALLMEDKFLLTGQCDAARTLLEFTGTRGLAEKRDLLVQRAKLAAWNGEWAQASALYESVAAQAPLPLPHAATWLAAAAIREGGEYAIGLLDGIPGKEACAHAGSELYQRWNRPDLALELMRRDRVRSGRTSAIRLLDLILEARYGDVNQAEEMAGTQSAGLPGVEATLAYGLFMRSIHTASTEAAYAHDTALLRRALHWIERAGQPLNNSLACLRARCQAGLGCPEMARQSLENQPVPNGALDVWLLLGFECWALGYEREARDAWLLARRTPSVLSFFMAAMLDRWDDALDLARQVALQEPALLSSYASEFNHLLPACVFKKCGCSEMAARFLARAEKMDRLFVPANSFLRRTQNGDPTHATLWKDIRFY